MRGRASLPLLELAVMLLVFALATVLCLQGFVWAGNASVESQRMDQAVVKAQTAAEILKTCGGDYEQAARLGHWSPTPDGWMLGYDENWQETGEAPACTITVTPQQSPLPLLGQAEVRVTDGNGVLLFSLPVCWQEVSTHT